MFDWKVSGKLLERGARACMHVCMTQLTTHCAARHRHVFPLFSGSAEGDAYSRHANDCNKELHRRH